MTENGAIARIRYRIDTATDIIGKGADGKAYEDMEMAIKALEEIQQYRDIGTVDECHKLKESQMVKKPNKADVQPYFRKHCANIYSCPSCHKKIVIQKQKFCHDCGQKLDWTEYVLVLEKRSSI